MEFDLKSDPSLDKFLKKGVKEPIKKAVFKIGTLGQNETKKNIKKERLIDTGQLRQSSIFKPILPEKTAGTITVGKEYGAIHEFGRGRYRERSFFRPMIQTLEKEAGGIIKDSIDKFIKKTIKR